VCIWIISSTEHNFTPFSTSKDFYLHADMPFTLTAGDKINIPITLSNNLNKPLTVNLFPSTTAETEFLSASIEKQEVVVPAASTEKVMLYIDTFFSRPSSSSTFILNPALSFSSIRLAFKFA
jgi:uncharacterized protein YfaS (alpha-2-macroglobulin family)